MRILFLKSLTEISIDCMTTMIVLFLICMIQKWLDLIGQNQKDVLESLKVNRIIKKNSLYQINSVEFYGAKAKVRISIVDKKIFSIFIEVKRMLNLQAKTILRNIVQDLDKSKFLLQADSLNHADTDYDLIDYRSENILIDGSNDDGLINISIVNVQPLQRDKKYLNRYVLINWLLYLLGGIAFGAISIGFVSSEEELNSFNVGLCMGMGLLFAVLFGLIFELTNHIGTKPKHKKISKRILKYAKAEGLTDGIAGILSYGEKAFYGAIYMIEPSKLAIIYEKYVSIKKLEIVINDDKKVAFDDSSLSVKSKNTNICTFIFDNLLSLEQKNEFLHKFGFYGEKYDDISKKTHELFVTYNPLQIYTASESSYYLKWIEHLEEQLVRYLFSEKNLSTDKLKSFFGVMEENMFEYEDNDKKMLTGFYNYLINNLVDTEI